MVKVNKLMGKVIERLTTTNYDITKSARVHILARDMQSKGF